MRRFYRQVRHTANRSRLLPLLLLLLAFYLLISSAMLKSPTVDEQSHLFRGIAYLKTGADHFRLGHPILGGVIAAFPLLTEPDLYLPTEDPSWSAGNWSIAADNHTIDLKLTVVARRGLPGLIFGTQEELTASHIPIGEARAYLRDFFTLDRGGLIELIRSVREEVSVPAHSSSAPSGVSGLHSLSMPSHSSALGSPGVQVLLAHCPSTHVSVPVLAQAPVPQEVSRIWPLIHSQPSSVWPSQSLSI